MWSTGPDDPSQGNAIKYDLTSFSLHVSFTLIRANHAKNMTEFCRWILFSSARVFTANKMDCLALSRRELRGTRCLCKRLLHPHTPSEDSWADRAAGLMLAGIADKAYRSLRYPGGGGVQRTHCACVLDSRPCYSACSIVWLLAGFLPARGLSSTTVD